MGKNARDKQQIIPLHETQPGGDGVNRRRVVLRVRFRDPSTKNYH